ncbi:PrsW family intramembrane metalloprotease [Nocardiopsis potens]|uniref:PrsW family intramembrane metalloprotease n=1 Tax=Nocardiopsis potens TaxID=1246458 RepID=UPI001267BD79|nr:PrsW family intramembrane metalloprotease [Nocardiopsis potens]
MTAPLAAAALFALLCAAGTASTTVRTGGLVRVFPVEALLAAATLAAVLAAGYWVLRRIRPVRPPGAAAAAAALLWGAAAAAGLALIANSALLSVWNSVLGVEAGTAWGPSLTAPLNEEPIKAAGVVILAVAAPAALRGPADGFVLGALAGLGFQLVENAIYALETIVMQGATAGGASVLGSLALRVGVTGAGSHWAMTAIAGTGVGLLAAARWRPGPRRAWAAGLLLLSAMALHAFFNAPVLVSLPGAAAKAAVVSTAALLVYLPVRAAYRRRLRNALEAEGQAVDLRRSDARGLATRHGRREALRRVPAPDRPAAARRQLRLLKAAERRLDRSPEAAG